MVSVSFSNKDIYAVLRRQFDTANIKRIELFADIHLAVYEIVNQYSVLNKLCRFSLSITR